MADVKSVMLTMLHGDFKKLYGFVCEIGNAEVAALIDECTVFPDETCPNILHVFWDAWTDGGEGERFVEDFIRDRSHHIAYVMDDNTVVERTARVAKDGVNIGSRVLNTCILNSVIPIVAPATYAEDTYGGIDWNTPVSASDAYDEPVYRYGVDDLNRG